MTDFFHTVVQRSPLSSSAGLSVTGQGDLLDQLTTLIFDGLPHPRIRILIELIQNTEQCPRFSKNDDAEAADFTVFAKNLIVSILSDPSQCYQRSVPAWSEFSEEISFLVRQPLFSTLELTNDASKVLVSTIPRHQLQQFLKKPSQESAEVYVNTLAGLLSNPGAAQCARTDNFFTNPLVYPYKIHNRILQFPFVLPIAAFSIDLRPPADKQEAIQAQSSMIVALMTRLYTAIARSGLMDLLVVQLDRWLAPIRTPQMPVIFVCAAFLGSIGSCIQRSQTNPITAGRDDPNATLSSRVFAMALRLLSLGAAQLADSVENGVNEARRMDSFRRGATGQTLQQLTERVEKMSMMMRNQLGIVQAIDQTIYRFVTAAMSLMHRWPEDELRAWMRGEFGLAASQDLLVCGFYLERSHEAFIASPVFRQTMDFAARLLDQRLAPSFDMRLRALRLISNVLDRWGGLASLTQGGFPYYGDIFNFFLGCDNSTASIYDQRDGRILGIQILLLVTGSEAERLRFCQKLAEGNVAFELGSEEPDDLAPVKFCVQILAEATNIFDRLLDALELLHDFETGKEVPAERMYDDQLNYFEHMGDEESSGDEEEDQSGEIAAQRAGLVASRSRRQHPDEVKGEIHYNTELLELIDKLLHVVAGVDASILFGPATASRLASFFAFAFSSLVGKRSASIRISNPLAAGFNSSAFAVMIIRLLVAFAPKAFEDPKQTFITLLHGSVDFEGGEPMRRAVSIQGIRNRLHSSEIEMVLKVADAKIGLIDEEQAINQDLYASLVNDAPDEFLDAITYEILRDPVILPSGHVLDKSTIQRHILENGEKNPITSETCRLQDCRPDPELKNRIQEWIRERIAQHSDSPSAAE